MRLTRRDAIAVLAAIGIGGGALAYTQLDGSGDDASALLATAVALADVLYPSQVEGREEFVRTYVSGRVEDDDARRAEMVSAAETLDARAREDHDAPFRDLAPEDGDALLRDMGMTNVAPDPEGSERERVRFYLVNELLYALLTSPKGGRLVDVENPPGHPGGLDAYQQGPQT